MHPDAVASPWGCGGVQPPRPPLSSVCGFSTLLIMLTYELNDPSQILRNLGLCLGHMRREPDEIPDLKGAG